MLKKRVVAAVAAALVAGSASAVTVNPEGVGDFLVAPAFFIGGGLTTDVKIINTHPTLSTVAKLVFRDKVTSAEYLDFLVYLSPNDVWNGKISCVTANAQGACIESKVESTDESSLLPDAEAFATAATPFVVVNNGTNGRVAFSNEGYIDIEMGPTFNIAPNQSPKAGVSKASIRAAYLKRIADGLTTVAADETPNNLTGSVKVTIPTFGTASIPMVALADYDTNTLPQVNVLSGLDIVGNRTSVSDVEEALWKDNLVLPYSLVTGGWSLATVTFPTKLTYNNRTDGQYAFGSTVCYTVDMFDNEEQTVRGGVQNISPLPTNQPSCATEMDFKLFGQSGMVTPYSEGWARMKFSAPATVTGQVRTPADNRNFSATNPRRGLPVIGTYMTRGLAGDLTWAYAPSHR